LVMHMAHLIASDPDFAFARSGVRRVTGMVRTPVVPVASSGHPWRYAAQATIAASLRRRANIGRTTTVEWHCQGEYRALHIPGHAMRRHTWHPRLDVALVPGFLVVAGNGQVSRFPVSEMILVTYARPPHNTVRVDLVDGDFVSIAVDNPGELVERIRSMIWNYEKQFLTQESPYSSTVGPAAEVVIQAEAILETIGPGGPTEVEDVDEHLPEDEMALRLAVLRRRRRRMNDLA